MKTISVIIPAYNRLNHLQKAVESCLTQTLLPAEIIIGDDSTNDQIKDWVDSVANTINTKIIYKKNRPSLGQGDNVNSLIHSVSTDYLLLLHDDDLLLPNALLSLYQPFISNPNIDVTFGKQYIIDENGNMDERKSENHNRYFQRISSFNQQILEPLEVLLKQQLPSNSFLIKSDLAKATQYGEKSFGGNGVDFHFCYKLALKNSVFFYVDRFISYYRLSADSISLTSNSGYYSFKLVEALNIENKELNKLKTSMLKQKAPIAIMQANKMKLKKEAWKIFFSKYHKAMIFSLGGLNRLFSLTFK